ncbi:hypothetical protein GYMLUDRAFT_893840 [Collybiopsis luxurians FD-317 M1]|uniref:Uncharacterized protein n=1 Tax=Collybiopsis luxurians FD-317 M1 TaxID=944289 RepID=A0A0D0BJ09_9AGAR|nr:hypothetical protein GYMLUDRAFT_893840 [Collybiopsis luxurians FD-317 M1]
MALPRNPANATQSPRTPELIRRYLKDMIECNLREEIEEDRLTASQLKEIGNQLFQEKKFSSAAWKYTKALRKTGESASLSVLYSNRSACRLKLQLFLDALNDATESTKLDPAFAKAFARRAVALDRLGQSSESAKAWEEALSKLPRGNLTPAELSVQSEYQKGLAAAKREKQRQESALKTQLGNYLELDGDKNDLPWMMAKTMLPELQRTEWVSFRYEQNDGEEVKVECPPSCIYALSKAYQYLCEGLAALEVYSAPNAPPFRNGSTSVLELLSNSVLTDYRVWHIQDPDYLDQFRQQANREVEFHGVFAPNLGPEDIKEIVRRRWNEAEGEEERLREWDTIQPALASIVRCWIMEGFHQGTLFENHDAETVYIKQAISFIKWGQTRCKDYPTQVKGEVFEEAFLKMVQGMRLWMLLKRFEDTKDSETQREVIYEESNQLLCEVSEGRTAFAYHSDPVIAAATYYNPRGYGLRLKAEYIWWKSAVGFAAFVLNSRASDYFAQDDVNHAACLAHCLHVSYHLFPNDIGLLLRNLEDIHEAVPKMEKIWKYKSLFGKEVRAEIIDDMLSWGRVTFGV